jgi:oligoribonuclease NrnB/cAMP/cGMP phosphodiesterase (DHH superfamily)
LVKENINKEVSMHRIVYHMDSDGKAAAAVVAHFLREEGKTDIYFHPINYGMTLNMTGWDRQRDQVFLVDFSFQPLRKMIDFLESMHTVTWIDHHATALEMEELDPTLAKIPGVRELGYAGCELAWRYFTPKPIPKALKLIGDWDTWRRGTNWETEVVPFQSFLYVNDDRPMNTKLWEQILETNDIESWLALGRVARLVQNRMDDSLIGAASFVGKFAGYRAVMCNVGGNSMMFERNYDVTKFELMILFQLKQGQYLTVSIYGINPDIDCGQLAKKLGEAGPIPSGGGHAQAAGFQCSWEYLWTLIRDVEDGKPWRISSTKQSINDLVKS